MSSIYLLTAMKLIFIISQSKCFGSDLVEVVNNPATAIIHLIEQTTQTLSDEELEKPYGMFLSALRPYLVPIGLQIIPFWNAHSELDTLKSLSKFVSDKHVEEAKIAVCRDFLRNSTYLYTLQMIVSMGQVIRIHGELKHASNLVESSRKKLAPGGFIAQRSDKANEHLTKAVEFLKEGDFELASIKINSAARCYTEVHTELRGIQVNINGQIKTLKSDQMTAASIAISTTIMTIQQVFAILSTPTTGVSLSFKVFSWGMPLVGVSVAAASVGEYFISDAQIKKLQEVFEEVKNKIETWSILSDEIDEMTDLILIKLRQAKNN